MVSRSKSTSLFISQAGPSKEAQAKRVQETMNLQRLSILKAIPASETPRPNRCRANSAHVRQSRPDSGLEFQVKDFTTFQVVPSSLRSGYINDNIKPESRPERDAVLSWKPFFLARFCLKVDGFVLRILKYTR